MPGGYAHFLPDTLRKIDRYWEGKFLGGDLDSTKKHKYFAQLARPLSEDASKNIDISTSMIKLLSTQQGKDLSMWVMGKELKEWLEEHAFDELIDELEDDLPRYGHIVVKKHGSGWDQVAIQNLRMDPSAPWLKHSDFVYELHRMLRWEIEEQVEKHEWNEEAVEKLFKASKSQDFDIYECYELEKDKYKLSYKAWFKKPNAASGGSSFGVEANINQPQNLNEPAITLFEDEIDIDDFPYREHKYSNVRGRWLGGGVMEYLFDDQLHANEVANLRMRALYLKALKILQSSDDNIGGNVLRDMINGQVLKSAGQLKWLQADESDLSAFGTEDNRWDSIATKKVFQFDSMNIPGRMNKQVLQRLLAQQQNYYKRKREKFGMFIKELLYNDVIPDFKNKTQKEHQMSFVGSYDDMDQFTKFVVEAHIEKAAMEYLVKTGFLPSQEERLKESKRIEDEIRKRNTQVLKIPKSFYENLYYKIQIVVTGENKDIEGETQFLMQLMQMVGTNPAVLQNKTLRTIVFKIMEMAGMSPGDIGMLDQSINAQSQSAGAQGGGTTPQGDASSQQGPVGQGAPTAKPPASMGAPAAMQGGKVM